MTTVEVSEVAILVVHSRSIAKEKLAWKHSLGVLEYRTGIRSRIGWLTRNRDLQPQTFSFHEWTNDAGL